MRKEYLFPRILIINTEELLTFEDVSGGDSSDPDSQHGGNGAKQNVTVWDDDDDNWGADSYTGF